MRQNWKYNAVTRTGYEVTGTVQGVRSAIVKELERRGMHVVTISAYHSLILRSIFRKPGKLSCSSLSQFFEDFHNMYITGMTIAQVLASLKETTHNVTMLDIISILEQKVRGGDTLNEAVARLKVFPWIVCTTLHAGEQSGKLQESLETLSKYFRRSNEIKDKLLNALTYPAIVFVVLMAVMMFVGLTVIPQLKNLLPSDSLSNTTTRVVIVISGFMQDYWLEVLLFLIVLTAVLFTYQSKHKEGFEVCMYRCPLIGNIIKESRLASYFLNLSVLIKSGIPLLRAVNDLHALNPGVVSRHFFDSRDFMFGGMSFWEAIQRDKFFSPVIVFTLRRGEEMARLDQYCLKLSVYFEKRVAQRIDRAIQLIQPVLLALGGMFLAGIEFAFLAPIYGSLSKIAGG